MASRLHDTIVELVWKAAHNNPNYGMRELKMIHSMHPTVNLDLLKRVYHHAKRAPKKVDWDVLKARVTQ